MRLLFLFLITSGMSFAQVGTGQWRLHIPAFNSIDVVEADNKIFAAYENGVLEYDLSSNEKSVWTAVNGLSDISISCLGKSGSTVFVGYNNGNLDMIRNNSLVNIPAIELAQIQGSKKIHRIVEYNNYVYLATGFAIVIIDPGKAEVKDTYYPTNGNDPIVDLAFRNDTLFALGEDRMYVGVASNPALADPAQWQLDPRVPVTATTEYSDIELFENDIYIVEKVGGFGNDTIHRLQSSSISPAVVESFPTEITRISKVGNFLGVCYFDGFILKDESLNSVAVINLYTFGNPKPNNGVYVGGVYYIADGAFGLVEYTTSNSSRINIYGPPKNSFYAMDWLDGKLVVAGGGISEITSTFNSSGFYVFEDEDWTVYDKGNVTDWNGQNIWDFISVSVNPTNTSEVAVATYSELPITIIGSDGQASAVYDPLNSPLETTSLGNGWTMVSEVRYDNAGNLWALNGYSDKPLKVLTNSGAWYEFDLGAAAKSKFTKKMVIDYNGNKWFGIKGVGLYGYNDNGTITNPSDDKYVNLNSGESSGALPSNEINAIAVDFDNEIWIGTDNGFAVLYDSDGAFDANPGEYNAQRIKLEFEGNVEYVLGATNILDIEVDGANRKWFATENSGILLLSADGLEILEHHTVENSPLVSNMVSDIKLDHETGELFCITDKGLVSFRTDATYEDPSYSNVKVFPNPARPDFEGPITIQGIRYNSDVKITDAAGNLVYKTTSNGGTATWDGKTLQGEKVSTGVYLIWTAANEGKGRFVGKVLIVN